MSLILPVLFFEGVPYFISYGRYFRIYQINVHNIIRKFEKFDEYHICNSSIRAEAFKFYHKNRYTTYKECLNPCKIMTVTTISKFKVFESSYDVEIYIPRQVEVTREVFVKSLLSLGDVLFT